MSKKNPYEKVKALVVDQFTKAGLNPDENEQAKTLVETMTHVILEVAETLSADQYKAIQRVEVMARAESGGYIGRDVEIFRKGIEHTLTVIKEHMHK